MSVRFHKGWSPKARAARWPLTVLERIMAKVVKDEVTGCWNFMGSQNGEFGYGCVWVNGKRKNAHRAMYMAVHGVELKPLEFVCHHCDNPKCVNPDHLWVGTNYQNARDMMDKGRHPNQRKTECKRGHPFSAENTYRNAGTGIRECKACTRARYRIKRGWPKDLAYNTAVVPFGYTRNVLSPQPEQRK